MVITKKQFKTGKRKKEFYDHKVTRTPTTRILCMGKVIPATWQYVRITILERKDNSVTCKFTKLLGENDIARSIEANPTNQQDT